LLSEQKPIDPGRTGSDNREFMKAIVRIARTGGSWRDLSEEFGKWYIIFKRLRVSAKLGPKPKLNHRQRQEALRMTDDGRSVRDIASVFNVGLATIQRVKEAELPYGYWKWPFAGSWNTLP